MLLRYSLVKSSGMHWIVIMYKGFIPYSYRCLRYRVNVKFEMIILGYFPFKNNYKNSWYYETAAQSITYMSECLAIAKRDIIRLLRGIFKYSVLYMYSHRLAANNVNEYSRDDIVFCLMHQFTTIYPYATTIARNISKLILVTSAFGMAFLSYIRTSLGYLLILITDFKFGIYFLIFAVILLTFVFDITMGFNNPTNAFLFL